jgi:hypothetical protein
MPQRTISSARQALEDMLPHLSDYQVREANQTLAQLEQEAQRQATQYMADREREVLDLRDSALRELTAVRDGYEALTAEGGTGRVGAEEYATALNRLVGRQFEAEERLARAEQRVNLIEHIEADPIAWFDDLTSRTRTWQEVPW